MLLCHVAINYVYRAIKYMQQIFVHGYSKDILKIT